MGNKINCFRIEKLDKPIQWKKRDGTLCAEDDPERSSGTPWYRRLDTNEEILGLQPGAIFFYDEIEPGYKSDHPGPDGRSLVVILPHEDWWFPDAPAGNSGTPWERTGTIPNITCKPSILTPRYHGWLTDGVLEEC